MNTQAVVAAGVSPGGIGAIVPQSQSPGGKMPALYVRRDARRYAKQGQLRLLVGEAKKMPDVDRLIIKCH